MPIGHALVAHLLQAMLLQSAPANASAPQPASQAAPACAARDADLPADLAGWATTGTGIGFDRSFQLSAAGGAASASFTIARAGRYRIALDQRGWIDVVRGDASVASTGHGHGPDCSTIRKLVAFDLEPGPYTLRLTRLTGEKARAMIVSPKS